MLRCNVDSGLSVQSCGFPFPVCEGEPGKYRYNKLLQHSDAIHYLMKAKAALRKQRRNTLPQQTTATLSCNTLLQHTTATHCYNTLLQHTVTTHSCNTLCFPCFPGKQGTSKFQCVSCGGIQIQGPPLRSRYFPSGRFACSKLQHTAAHCSTMQHTATHCNTLQQTAAHCSALQHNATHCNTLQHTATHCSTLQNTHMVLDTARLMCQQKPATR